MNAIDFEKISWEQSLPGARFKISAQGDKQLRLLELTDEFIEPHWCENGHSGIVLLGTLDIQFKNGVVRYNEGMAIHIPAGSNTCHKAKAVTPIVRLFLVENAA